jgi:UDP-galactose transporter B1
MEWIGAALITTGIISFQYTQLQKQHSNHGGNAEKGDSPYGLFLLGVSLFMDGLLGACQSALKRKGSSKSIYVYRPPTAMETMLYINLYATAILLPASYYAGQFQSGVKVALDANGDVRKLLLQLNLSASLGQVFIFLTIHHFSPLICTTITTTRKFFTILLSVYKFGHVLDVWQWGSVGLVFSGLYLEIAAKMLVGQRRDVQKKKAD